MRVLLIEDEPHLGSAVQEHVRAAGHAVDWFERLEPAEHAVRTVSYDALLLDLHLPDGRGLDFLRKLRRRGDALPVVILTARDLVSDRIEGLKAGADDYIVKPFSMTEFLARLRAVMRRVRPSLVEDIVTVGEISIDRGSHRVRRSSRDIHLGPTEYRLLDQLMQHPGRVFSREQLLDSVWGSDVYVEARTVDVHVGRLRKALNQTGEKDPIRTVRSAGYSFDETFAI